jgi:hypothetical protein
MKTLTEELQSIGAREFEIVILAADEERAWAAITAAQERGADNMVRYALSLFDDPAWQPNPGKPRVVTNASASIPTCQTCGGDRFVLFSTRPAQASAWMNERGIKPKGEEIEEMAPCPDCNPADTTFWRVDGTKFQGPDPAKVRERMSR